LIGCWRIRPQHPEIERIARDWRILASRKGDEMLYERHATVTDGLLFAELEAR
jgi:hypothetical protein